MTRVMQIPRVTAGHQSRAAYLAAERRDVLVQRGELIIQSLDRAPDVLLHGLLGDHLRRSASHQHTPPGASALPVILPDAPKRNQSYPPSCVVRRA